MSLRKVRKILLLCLAGLVILILTLMLGVKLTLDRAPQYQTQIKDWVFRQTGYHIAFARVSPAFRWYGPELYFDRFELRSKDNRRVLARAAGGRIGADVWQLFRTRQLFAMRIELDSPDITIVRMAPDTFAIASEIVLGGDQSSFLGTLTLNDLPAGTLAIRRGFVTIQDWNSALPRLELTNVNLDLRRGARLIGLNVTAQLPAVLGGSLRFNGTARGAGQLQSLDWDALARTRDMSFPGWRELLPGYLTRLDAGTGAFELVAQGRGSVLGRAALDFGAQGVVTNLTDGPTAKFAEISGVLTATHAGDRWTLAGRRLHAFTAGHRDPDSEFDATWRGNDAGVLELRARASYLRADAPLFLVRAGNPRRIRDWDDLARPGVRVVLANPKTSGNGRYAYLGIYVDALEKNRGDERKAQDILVRVLGNVAVMDSGGRGATTTFVEREVGDVLVTFESEVNSIRRERPDAGLQSVVPPMSVQADFPVAVVDKVVERHGTRELATAYTQFLFTDPAQEILARNFNRVRSAAVAPRYQEQFPRVRLVALEQRLGEWQTIARKHFDEGGLLDRSLAQLPH